MSPQVKTAPAFLFDSVWLMCYAIPNEDGLGRGFRGTGES